MRKGSSNISRFGRPRSQRQALLKSLADSLILDESIATTLPKAKAAARYTEKLVAKAKEGKNSIHNRRMVIAGLNTVEAAHKLVEEIAPKLSGRNSGYFRVEKLAARRGDNARLARVSFVDDLKTAKKSQKDKTSIRKADKAGESLQKGDNEPVPRAVKDTESKIQPKMTTQSPKRSGVRGNR